MMVRMIHNACQNPVLLQESATFGTAGFVQAGQVTTLGGEPLDLSGALVCHCCGLPVYFHRECLTPEQ